MIGRECVSERVFCSCGDRANAARERWEVLEHEDPKDGTVSNNDEFLGVFSLHIALLV